jgi:hypothetical protein
MFQKEEEDFVLAQIEIMAAVMARLVVKRENKDSKEGILEARAGCMELVGLDSAVILDLSDETVHGLFTLEANYYHTIKCLAAGTLLKEQGEFHEALGELVLARSAYRKALILLVEALLMEKDFRTDEHLAKIDALMQIVPAAELSYSLQQRLVLYHRLLPDTGSENEIPPTLQSPLIPPDSL